jgi:hypothetical protein
LAAKGGFDPSNFKIGQLALTSIGTPGAQIDIIPTETALPCLFNMPRPFFCD